MKSPQIDKKRKQDTGWIDLKFYTGKAYDDGYKPQIRRVGKVVYTRGKITGFKAQWVSLFALDKQFRPSQTMSLLQSGDQDPSSIFVYTINKSGAFFLQQCSKRGGTPGAPSESDVINFNLSWLVD